LTRANHFPRKVTDIVLDEDVFVFALSVEASGDLEDKAAAQFLICLQERHRWVLSIDVAAAYRRHLGRQRQGKGGVASGLVASLDGALHSERFRWLPNPPAITGEYHDDDRHIVAAAAASAPSVLVTSDGRLTAKLIGGQIAENNGFRVMDPFEALSEFCESG
jgi:hypothetical protein